MICKPEFVTVLGQRARDGDVTSAETLCNCFRPEIREAAKQVNYWDKKLIEQEICDDFIFTVMNSDPVKDQSSPDNLDQG